METITIPADIINGMLRDLRTVTTPKSDFTIDGMVRDWEHAMHVAESIEKKLEQAVLEAMKDEL